MRALVAAFLALLALSSPATAGESVVEWVVPLPRQAVAIEPVPGGDFVTAGYLANVGFLGAGPRSHVWMGVSRVSPAGAVLWSRYLRAGRFEFAVDVAVAADGSTYVAGWTSTDPPYVPAHAVVYRLDAKGKVMWRFTAGDALPSGEPVGIAVDADGAAYVAIRGQQESGIFPRAVVLKLTASGDVEWTRTLAQARRTDYPADIVAGDDGAIYVCATLGWDVSEPGDQQFGGRLGVFALDTSGATTWRRTVGRAEGHTVAQRLAAAPGGGVVVAAGTSDDIGGRNRGDRDLLLARFSADGRRLWTELMGGADDDRATGLAVTDRYVFASGVTDSPRFDDAINAGNQDLFVVRFTLGGVSAGSTLIGGPEHEYATGLAPAGASSVLLVAEPGAFPGEDLPEVASVLARVTFR